MKGFHFFKAKSRLGLINPPYKQEDFNLGVEHASDYILSKNFLKKFNQAQISEYIFPKPEDIENEDFDIVLARHLNNFKNQINKVVTSNQISPIVIGGDHSVSFSSLCALIKRTNDVKNIGIIMFDSDGDINLYKESPSKNFHGMWLRPFISQFDKQYLDHLIPRKIPPKNLLYIGNLSLDPGEVKLIKGKKIKNITSNWKEQEKQTLKEIVDFIKRFEYLHVSFDIDVFDKTEVSATGKPSENGFKENEIFPLLEIICKHPNFSFDLCEVNPKKQGIKKTLKISQKILRAVLS